jgi:hypothetical protein
MNASPRRIADKPTKQEPKPTQAIGCSAYSLWFMWLLASMLGMGLGWALGWRLSFAIPGVLATWAIGIIAGGFLGASQALVLRPLVSSSSLWILANILGWPIGFFLGAQLASIWGFTEFAFGAVIGAMIGLVLGLAQWLVLRTKLAGSSWWIPVSIIAWTLSLIAYLPGLNAMGFLYGAISGSITGLFLLGLRFGIFLPT